MSKRYTVRTLADIADIPDEALPRFIAELPAFLKSRKQMMAAANDLAADAKAKAPWFLRWAITERTTRAMIEMAKVVWVDDDKGTVTLNMAAKDGDDPFYSRTEKLGA